MYNSIHELPSQVTASLDDRDARKWMRAYNKELPKDPDSKAIARARRKAWESVKSEPSSFSFHIKASIEVVDKDGEIIDVDSLRRHMDSFIEYGGNVQDEHGNYTVACIWGWDPCTEDGRKGVEVWGNMFGGDTVYERARRNFISGRNNLSVAGEADNGRYMCDDRGCYVRRNVTQLMEISLCDVPANRHATLIWYNKDARVKKSVEQKALLSVDEYTLHKDYTACPVQALKKSALDAGFTDVHARDDGILIQMSAREALSSVSILKSLGSCVVHVDGGVFVGDRGRLVESAFKKGYSEGWVDSKGYLNGSTPESEFKRLYELGLTTIDSNGCRLTL